MKYLLTATALVLAAAGVASAMTMPGELSVPDRAEAERLVPAADFSNLTVEQAGAIASILYGGDQNRAGQIRALLN